MAGIYIHIPFCKRRCIYCDFFSTTASNKKNKYVKALCKEIAERKGYLGGETIETIYLGGGTPSQLEKDDFRNIFSVIYDNYNVNPEAEITIEANPDDLTDEYVEMLATLPFNRLSMGIQTFNDDILSLLKRRHNAQQAIDALHRCRNAGFGNISIDLMYGLPGESIDTWNRDLDTAISLMPEHISAYQLSVEPGSVLGQLVSSGKYAEASDVCCSRQYDMLCGFLAEAGYRHYEISNFALPGHEARHNSGYWTHSPYVGLGPAAHSFSLSGRRRSWNVSSLSGYLAASSERPDLLPDGAPVFSGGHEILTDRQLAMEKIMLGLRTDTGVDEGYLRENTRAGAVDRALESGSLCRSRSCLRIPEVRFFVSDNIIAELF